MRSRESSIRAVVLSVGDYLLSYLPAQAEADIDVELRVNERVKRGIAGVRCHGRQCRGVSREQVGHHRR